jgi:hypothetical protein
MRPAGPMTASVGMVDAAIATRTPTIPCVNQG